MWKMSYPRLQKKKEKYISTQISCIVVHNRDWDKNYQNSLIECTPKAAFRTLDVFQKPSRPSSGVVKTDLEV